MSEVTRPSSASTLDLFLVPDWDTDMLIAEVGPPLCANLTSSNKDSDHCTVTLRCKQLGIEYFTTHQQRTHIVYDLRKTYITRFENELIRLGFNDLHDSDDSISDLCSLMLYSAKFDDCQFADINVSISSAN